MRHLLIILLASIATSCDDAADALLVSTNAITLDAAGREQRVTVHANNPLWEVIVEADWPVIERDSLDIIITAASNPRRAPRVAHLYIAAGNRFERVTITQNGSLHVFGDPYPDANNPVGIIYKVIDGGEHGMILSLDQLDVVPWGPVTDTHETGPLDGKANTRAIIAARAGSPTFATDYPAFAWVHEKNGNQLDGEWYIPSIWELIEMYNFIIGNFSYVIPGGNPPTMQIGNTYRPAHDLVARAAFDAGIIALGGTPFNFAASLYWSSTETSATNASALSFNNGTDYMHTNISNYKTYSSPYFFRAVRAF
ncbi:MAG: hypothetical protein LBF09_03830 [Odoribacteraceae bacterium]|jgi:hypothetical protein|nr:hypothetical protein [Odoribacteraceae bacterium]